MNAGERRKNRRFKSLVNAGREANGDRLRADNAEIQLAHVRGRLAEVEENARAKAAVLELRMAALVNARDELFHENQRLGHVAARRLDDIARHITDNLALTDRLTEAMRELSRLRNEDHDSAKLRRRLRDAHAETASAHARVRALEAAARPARVDGAEAFAWTPPAAKEPA